MTHKRSKTVIASAVSLALAGMMLATSVNAGVIDNSNNAPGKLGACGVTGPDTTACVGAWDLDNVAVTLLRVFADGTVQVLGELFDELTGVYTAMTYGDTWVDSFASYIYNSTGTTLVAKLSGKTWPVGEPTGIKAVVGDVPKDGKPANCLINTSYLLDTYLDSADPMPVLCSSDFQTHKRFKIAMLPPTVDTVPEPIDLVFNVKDDGTTKAYQVFSKINNYTDKRLAGYKIVVGTGTGAGFVAASNQGIADKLFISLGLGEGSSSGTNGVPDGSDMFEANALANFSHGLFGPIEENEHFLTIGFFSDKRAFYPVAAKCASEDATVPVACLTYPYTYTDPVTSTPITIPLKNSDTIYSSAVLSTNYTSLFGDWLPSKWMPKGIFHDDDNNPTTDAVLMAWWNGTNWIKNYASGFAVASADEIKAWAADRSCGSVEMYSCYGTDDIEDVLNLGLGYIVKVGDNIDGDNDPATDSKITIRITPVVSDDQTAPAWASSPPPVIPVEPLPLPTPLPPAPAPTDTATSPVVSSSDSGGGGGGGCAIGNDGRFDPTLPAMLFAGLGFLGWRRYKAGK